MVLCKYNKDVHEEKLPSDGKEKQKKQGEEIYNDKTLSGGDNPLFGKRGR